MPRTDHRASWLTVRRAEPDRHASKKVAVSHGKAFAAGVASGVLLGRSVGDEQARFARLSGWSIAAPDAAGWVTDFLNAAYYRRRPEEREVDDLRLALAIVTTHWWRRGGRRLHLPDILPFQRGYGRLSVIGGLRSPLGTLNREQLLEGAAKLLGGWFPEAYRDDTRRAWGIAFPSQEDKSRYRPESRLELAALEELTPPAAPGEQQGWHTYSPVEVSSAEAVIEALARTESWPDYASETGRFTPLRSSQLEGQTFEIEVAAGTVAAGRPVFQRGYVTVTRRVSRDDPAALAAYFAELAEGLARFGDNEPRLMPEGAEPIFGIDLTTHKGHFMGHGRNRLVVFSHDDRSYLRAAGTWDPMPWHVRTMYRLAGRDAQHAFWGRGGTERQSMLHQIAQRVG